MPSYYNRIKGTLEVAKLAKASDINLIQSSVQDAISSVITDLFGPSFVLGEAENDLTLIPTAIHTDQANYSCDEEDQWLSFYERYFRQPLFIEKSAIESITLHMINDSNITTTVYAEIRDINYNLLKESNAKLEPTKSDEIQEVTFNFGLNHLGVGRYYFILKPIDISAADLALNGDETEYDTITSDMFCVRYDRDGNYEAGLEASYNGVDYLEAYMLEDELEYNDSDSMVTHDTNFDLYFEHTFSSGNTYLINPGAAIVQGQKVYPMDTHVTIAGPSSIGDRTDLVILTQEGYLKVIQGTVYNGAIKRPQSNSGLKIAYITSYKTESSNWVCPNCETTNDGSMSVCYNCGTSVNTKVPFIEQADDNGKTRQRDVLERLRRLEKMMVYEQEYNRPTRVKFSFTYDPRLFTNIKKPTTSNTDKEEDQKTIDADETYGFTTRVVNGETVTIPTGAIDSKDYIWAIRDDMYEDQTFINEAITETGTLYVWDLVNYASKPTKVELGNCITVRLVGSNGKGMPNIPIDIKVNGKGNNFTTTKNTNSNGNIRIDPYSSGIKWAAGTYTITATHNGKSVKAKYYIVNKKSGYEAENLGINVLKVNDGTWWDLNTVGPTQATNVKTNKNQVLISATVKIISTGISTAASMKQYKIERHETKLNVIKTQSSTYTKSVPIVNKDAILGDDSFTTDNAEIDTKNGAFKIARIFNTDAEYTTNEDQLLSSDPKETLYIIKNDIKDAQSSYPLLNFSYNGGYIHSLTPYIKKFKNIEWFQIILFRNDLTFGQVENHRVSYKKRLDEDGTFPNVYVSPKVEIDSSAVTDKQGNKRLNAYHKFVIDQELTKGNYSLLFYGKIAEGYDEACIFVDEYSAMSNSEEYGMATRVTGTSNPSIIYMDTNDSTNFTWNLLREERGNQFKPTGIVISKPIKVDSDYNITSVKLDYNDEVPNGCDLQVQVSNDGGRNWVTAKNNNAVSFSGGGGVFEWKIIMRSSGIDTPVFSFNKTKGYAIKATLNMTTSEYSEYEDYERQLPTPLMDFVAMTYKVFGDSSITQKDFSEWEWARLFMDDDSKSNEIHILVSNGDTDSNPVYINTVLDDWNKNVFFHQAICGLTLDDFEHTSVDYSNYDPTLESDEYNFRFKFDTSYAETMGSGKIIGNYINTSNFVNYEDVGSDRFEIVNHSELPHIYYADDNTYGSIVTEPYYGYKYKGPLDDGIYYNSDDDDTYDRNRVLVGMVFENGLKIDDTYINLNLDVFVSMDNIEGRPVNETKTRIVYDENGKPVQEKENEILQYIDENKTIPKWEQESSVHYFPPKTFELIVSLNEYGLMDDDMTYGKRYVIDTPLYDKTFNRISVPIYDDFMGDTIYSIGIRAIDHDTESIGESNQALMEGDVIALGDLLLGSNDRALYWPGGERYAWKKGGIPDDDDATKQRSFASVIHRFNGTDYFVIFPLTNLDDYDFIDNNNKNDVRNIDAHSTYKKETPFDIDMGSKHQTMFVEKLWGTGEDNGIGVPIKYHTGSVLDTTSNHNEIDPHKIYIKDNTLIYDEGGVKHTTYMSWPEMIFNFIYEPSVKEPLFYIDVDFTLDPYTWVRIEHWLEAEVIDPPNPSDPTYTLINNELTYKTNIENNVWTHTKGQIHAGDIIFEFYDTRDHDNSNIEPIETFTLPAWGQVQTRAKRYNKEVNAWYKIRNGGRVKRIVVRRKNPTGKNTYPLKLHLYDIGMHRGKTVPAFGSQMQMRLYPKGDLSNTNISIRKVGVVYRLA